MKLPAFLEKISWTQLITPVMNKFRKRRLVSLVQSFPDLSNYTVLDVGGRPNIWMLLKKYYGIEPKRLVLLNLEEDVESFEAEADQDPNRVNYEVVIGDGTRLPFADQSFDLAFSNSVIEHVGDSEAVVRFARECERVGEQVYIQTPNHWFPIEPHLVTVGIHWLPRSLYRKLSFLSMFYLLYAWRSESLKAIHYEEFDSIRLLKLKQLRRLFPHKTIKREQVLGMTKSFILTDA